MAHAYKRADLRKLAQAKLDDAVVLVQHGRHSSAYYLAGYAAEMGLKACISRLISSDSLPDPNFIKKVYDHNLMKLVGLAGLAGELSKMKDSDSVFAANWAIVVQWTPEIRYESIDRYTADLMLDALQHGTSGVFPWIKRFW